MTNTQKENCANSNAISAFRGMECIGQAVLKDNLFSVSTDCIFSYPIHTHAHFEMTLYEAFSGSIHVNGVEFTITTPTIILLNPSGYHKITVNGTTNSRFIKVAFAENILYDHLFQIPNWPLILEHVSSDSFLYRLFRELYHNSSDPACASQIINLLVYLLMQNAEKIAPAETSKDHALAMRAVRILNETYCSPITLQTTATLLSVSPQYLSTIFSKHVGVSFSQYLCDLRLRYAAELMQQNKSSITQICYQCGYRNLSHFLRSFKKKYGVTPKSYRAMCCNS